jgi:hypothetical protein
MSYRKKYILWTWIITILMVCLSLEACRSSKPRNTSVSATLEPTASETPIHTVAVLPPEPTVTSDAVSLVPVFTNNDTPEPTLISTETPIPTPTPTETSVPPLVVTPDAPFFPITGVEITRYSDIDLAAQAGVYWVRRNALLWSVVESTEGQREWGAVASLDKELEAISAYGMQTILIVRGTPAWAQKIMGIHCGPMMPEKLASFAAFMHDAVARYSQPPFNVKYWELGNEPDVDPALVAADSPFGCWGDPNDTYYGGGYYAEMMKVVYPAIKAADPDAQVLVGGLLLLCNPDNPPDVKGQPGVKADCSPTKFMEGILRNGGGDYFDGISFHAYDYYFDVLGKYGNSGWYSSWKTTGPVLIAKATYLRNLLTQYGYRDKFLMNTEVAALCGNTGKEPSCQQDDWVKTKTYHLVEAYTAAAIVGLRANVWFCVAGWRGSGLVDGYSQPVPAYNALVFNTQILRDAIPWGEVTLYEGVKGFAFEREGKLLWVLWSLDGLEHSIPLGTLPSFIYNVLGESLIPEINITISLSPIYIEW